MAKWGEGDPRWIVEERADATNVNNWHWTEKNASAWSKDTLKRLLEGMEFDDDGYSATITTLEKIEGDASANNRKAKLIFFYEWEINGKWTGTVDGNTKTYEGKFNIPNLSDENDPKDIEVTFTTDNNDDDAYKIKEYIRKVGTKAVQDAVGEYIKLLKEEYSRGMILPSKSSSSDLKNIGNSTQQAENKAKQELNKPVVACKTSDVGVRIPCKRLSAKEEFKCPPSEIYRALTELDMVRAFTRNNAEVEAEKGGSFKMFDGNIYGEFIDLVRDTKIEMRWRFKTWPSEHYSKVIIDLTDKGDCTELALTQTGVPESDFDRTREGWKRYYWEAIKQTFGYGACLF